MVDYGTDQLLLDIADYVIGYELEDPEALQIARYALLDSLGCALLALNVPEARAMIGPLVPGAGGGPHGARVPGTSYTLDPCGAAFSTGALVAWLGYNDAWLAAEWVHPSDTLGALLAVADHVSALRRSRGAAPLLVRELLSYLVKAYEICGLLACDNALNTIGVDGGPLFAKVAASACCAALLGGGRREVAAAASQAFGDGASLRCFRHAPGGAGGGRSAWAAGDAASRAVWHALHALRGEPGLPLVLSAPVWGFQDVFFRRAPLALPRPLGEHVAPRVLFRAVVPAEAHAAACAEAALPLHPLVCHRVEEVAAVVVHAPRAAVRAADRTGPLGSPAERAHCIQYAVAAALLYGTVSGEHFSDAVAADPRLAELRARTAVAEHPPFSAAYADASSRATPAAVQVHFADRSATPQAALTYTLGHAARRAEGLPALRAKLLAALRSRFPPGRAGALAERFADAALLDATSVPDLLDLLADPPMPHALAHAAPPMPMPQQLPQAEPPLLAAGVARIALTAPPPPAGGEVPMQGGGSPREAWRSTDGSTTARTWRPEPH